MSLNIISKKNCMLLCLLLFLCTNNLCFASVPALGKFHQEEITKDELYVGWDDPTSITIDYYAKTLAMVSPLTVADNRSGNGFTTFINSKPIGPQFTFSDVTGFYHPADAIYQVVSPVYTKSNGYKYTWFTDLDVNGHASDPLNNVYTYYFQNITDITHPLSGWPNVVPIDLTQFSNATPNVVLKLDGSASAFGTYYDNALNFLRDGDNRATNGVFGALVYYTSSVWTNAGLFEPSTGYISCTDDYPPGAITTQCLPDAYPTCSCSGPCCDFWALRGIDQCAGRTSVKCGSLVTETLYSGWISTDPPYQGKSISLSTVITQFQNLDFQNYGVTTNGIIDLSKFWKYGFPKIDGTNNYFNPLAPIPGAGFVNDIWLHGINGYMMDSSGNYIGDSNGNGITLYNVSQFVQNFLYQNFPNNSIVVGNYLYNCDSDGNPTSMDVTPPQNNFNYDPASGTYVVYNPPGVISNGFLDKLGLRGKLILDTSDTVVNYECYGARSIDFANFGPLWPGVSVVVVAVSGWGGVKIIIRSKRNSLSGTEYL